MFRTLFRTRSRGAVIARLHDGVAAASRRPALYERLGVPDTIEGRFETLVLHLVLVLRRLRRLPPPAEDVAQDLVDAFFRALDASLRETGVGDMGLPKRMNRLAQAFYGRARAYDEALDAGDLAKLAEALARNVLGGARAGDALAAYALAGEDALAEARLDDLLARGPRFPEPAAEALQAEARP
jgi:cytochrome b pre-mRNA-processing protein 3